MGTLLALGLTVLFYYVCYAYNAYLICRDDAEMDHWRQKNPDEKRECMKALSEQYEREDRMRSCENPTGIPLLDKIITKL